MGPAIPLYRPSRSLDRPSRVSGNLVVVCQDCGGIRQYRRDSRLRGNDGRGGLRRQDGCEAAGKAGFLYTISRKIRPISPLLIRGGVL